MMTSEREALFSNLCNAAKSSKHLHATDLPTYLSHRYLVRGDECSASERGLVMLNTTAPDGP